MFVVVIDVVAVLFFLFGVFFVFMFVVVVAVTVVVTDVMAIVRTGVALVHVIVVFSQLVLPSRCSPSLLSLLLLLGVAFVGFVPDVVCIFAPSDVVVDNVLVVNTTVSLSLLFMSTLLVACLFLLKPMSLTSLLSMTLFPLMLFTSMSMLLFALLSSLQLLSLP